MGTITLTIDGKKVEVERGSTILKAIEKADIYIPTLCYHPDLTPFGACRLCLVEVENMRGFPPACTTPATDGMVVRTNTPPLQELRRHILELILSEHPHSCLVCERKETCEVFRECMRKTAITTGCLYCPQNGRCELQRAVEYIGLKETVPDYVYKGLPVQREPFFDRDYNLCVLCGRCVRICQEVRGVGAIAFTYRGNETIIDTAFRRSLQEVGCEFCGACIDACPTGALSARFEKWGKPEFFVTTICPFCGVGCQVEVGVENDHIVRVRGKRWNTPNNGQLCVKGRFGLDFVDNPERLEKPLMRKDGELIPVSWDEALDFVARKFSQYKGDSFALLSSAKCTNEENYLAQKFGRAVMETNNVDHCARLCHASTVVALVAAFGSGAMTNSIEEIKDANCVFIIGSNTTEQHPVIALKIKEAKRKDAKIIVANPRWIELCEIADLWLRHKPGTDVPLILGMCQVIIEEDTLDKNFIEERCEGFEEFRSSLSDFSLKEAARITGVEESLIKEAARLYARNKPSSIIYAMGITQHSHGTDNILSLANLSVLTGNVGRPSTGINPLRGQNNVQGACDMGALPDLLPGYQSVKNIDFKKKFENTWGKKIPDEPGLTVVEMFDAIHEGKIKAMYIIGENPYLSDPNTNHVVEALNKLDFLVVQDIFLSETASLADVVLPAASSLEKDGTFTNTERRVQRVRKVLSPVGESRPDWEIICEVAKRMGQEKNFSCRSPSEIMEEISKLTPIYGGINYERLDAAGIQWPCPDTSHPGTPYLHKDRFTRGKGKFHPIKYRPSMELPDEEYPFVLTTGRTLFHFHTGTMTRRVHDLNYIRNEEFVEISPEDARSLGIKDGEPIEISSRRGKVRAKAKVTEKSAQGVVFLTFHFAETPTNVLTNPTLDPVAKIPEFKVCAVKLKKVSGD